jgi:hypothetical protein
MRFYITDFDERFAYMDSDGKRHDIALRDLTVDELLPVVRCYKLKNERVAPLFAIGPIRP